MSKVIGIVPVAPMRKEASHRAEMVSQILFGETATILEEEKDFTKIKTDFDDYEGWVQSGQLEKISEESDIKISGFASKDSVIQFNNQPMRISVGTPVSDVSQIGKYTIDYSKVVVENALAFNETNLKEKVFYLLNTSYLWGGRHSAGIDCSGFAQLVYKFFNVFLPRDAHQQAAVGATIDFLEQTKCGDLAYFDNADGKIIHVGILLENKTIIHASGKVRIDKIDAQGIVNSDTGIRTHNLRIIKRVL